MTTSSADLRQIDLLLTGALPPGERLVLEARLINEPALRDNFRHQRIALDAIRAFGRKKLKIELEKIHDEIFSDPGKREFQNKVKKLFSI